VDVFVDVFVFVYVFVYVFLFFMCRCVCISLFVLCMCVCVCVCDISNILRGRILQSFNVFIKQFPPPPHTYILSPVICCKKTHMHTLFTQAHISKRLIHTHTRIHTLSLHLYYQWRCMAVCLLFLTLRNTSEGPWL
jgi:hypothetical protein